MKTELNSLDERLADFANIWEKMGGDDQLVVRNEPLMAYLNSGGFFTAPASTKYHGAYEGGLYDHSRMVAMRLHVLTINNGLKWRRPESPFIIGMFHDLCKCDQYVLTEEPEKIMFAGQDITPVGAEPVMKYVYNENTLLKGHGAKSVMILSQYINLTEEEMLCIRFHMGAYEKTEYDWNDLDRAIKYCPNTFWVHVADMLASKIDRV